ncbi:MAG TPA: hypothetical protein VHG53_05570 [Candidatus Limnocylindria bacterium]|nr:hypothetical protein [Candidatus Limnocylindria bacterium]
MASPGIAGVELASGIVRAVVGYRDDGRLRVTGVGHAALAPGAVSGGHVADRRALVPALASALAAAERAGRAERVIVAIDGDDIRTYHDTATFERIAQDGPVSAGEAVRATRLAREAAARTGRDLAADDPSLRGVATAELRDDVAGFVIDGRTVASAVGHRGRHIEVRTDIALAPLVQAGAATAVLDAAKRRATATCGVYALARLLAESGIAEAGLARISADLTAIAVVREGRVVATRAFGLGGGPLLARGSTPGDAAVWARCVSITLSLLGVEIPAQWYVAGVTEELSALPPALASVLGADRGGAALVLPLRTSLAARVIADATLGADDLVAAGAAALGSEAYA